MTQANSVDEAGSWPGVVLPVTGHGAVRVRPSTRSKGLGELQRHNIVETSSKVISEPVPSSISASDGTSAKS